MKDQEYSVVMTTVAADGDPGAIIKPLLERQLAACIQVMPIESHYTWKGSVSVDREQLLLIKGRSELFPEIEACIREHHAYEVPEIIQVPVMAGAKSYLGWINDVSRGGSNA
jgi:periplasmic divalent cation tolerance protein